MDYYARQQMLQLQVESARIRAKSAIEQYDQKHRKKCDLRRFQHRNSSSKIKQYTGFPQMNYKERPNVLLLRESDTGVRVSRPPLQFDYLPQTKNLTVKAEGLGSHSRRHCIPNPALIGGEAPKPPPIFFEKKVGKETFHGLAMYVEGFHIAY